METESITCPYCWQTIDIESPHRHAQPVVFVTDCEVCCRPIRATFSWADLDDEPIIEVEPES